MGTSGLGNLLVEEGLLTESDRRTIKRECGTQGAAFAKSIIALGLLDEDELAAFLAERTHHKVAPKDLASIADESTLATIDRPIMERLEVVPLTINRSTLRVAMADPLDYDAVSQLRFFTGYRIQPLIATFSQIHSSLLELFPDFEPQNSSLEDFLKNHMTAANVQQTLKSGPSPSDTPSDPIAAEPEPEPTMEEDFMAESSTKSESFDTDSFGDLAESELGGDDFDMEDATSSATEDVSLSAVDDMGDLSGGDSDELDVDLSDDLEIEEASASAEQAPDETDLSAIAAGIEPDQSDPDLGLEDIEDIVVEGDGEAQDTDGGSLFADDDDPEVPDSFSDEALALEAEQGETFDNPETEVAAVAESTVETDEETAADSPPTDAESSMAAVDDILGDSVDPLADLSSDEDPLSALDDGPTEEDPLSTLDDGPDEDDSLEALTNDIEDDSSTDLELGTSATLEDEDLNLDDLLDESTSVEGIDLESDTDVGESQDPLLEADGAETVASDETDGSADLLEQEAEEFSTAKPTSDALDAQSLADELIDSALSEQPDELESSAVEPKPAAVTSSPTSSPTTSSTSSPAKASAAINRALISLALTADKTKATEKVAIALSEVNITAAALAKSVEDSVECAFSWSLEDSKPIVHETLDLGSIGMIQALERTPSTWSSAETSIREEDQVTLKNALSDGSCHCIKLDQNQMAFVITNDDGSLLGKTGTMVRDLLKQLSKKQ